MNSPQGQALFTNSSSNNVPIFLRWQVLFSQLPSRPFGQGVGAIVAWMVLLSFLLHPLHAYLDHTWGPLVPPTPLRRSMTDVFFNVVVVAPVVETWLFLTCIFKVAQWVKLLPRYPQVVIALSAALFALSHLYSIGYMVSTFPTGCLLEPREEMTRDSESSCESERNWKGDQSHG